MGQKNTITKGARMGKQKTEKIGLPSMEYPDVANEKGVRIIDGCHHFLGKNLERRVYIYCGKCKSFVHVDK